MVALRSSIVRVKAQETRTGQGTRQTRAEKVGFRTESNPRTTPFEINPRNHIKPGTAPVPLQRGSNQMHSLQSDEASIQRYVTAGEGAIAPCFVTDVLELKDAKIGG